MRRTVRSAWFISARCALPRGAQWRVRLCACEALRWPPRRRRPRLRAELRAPRPLSARRRSVPLGLELALGTHLGDTLAVRLELLAQLEQALALLLVLLEVVKVREFLGPLLLAFRSLAALVNNQGARST